MKTKAKKELKELLAEELAERFSKELQTEENKNLFKEHLNLSSPAEYEIKNYFEHKNLKELENISDTTLSILRANEFNIKLDPNTIKEALKEEIKETKDYEKERKEVDRDEYIEIAYNDIDGSEYETNPKLDKLEWKYINRYHFEAENIEKLRTEFSKKVDISYQSNFNNLKNTKNKNPNLKLNPIKKIDSILNSNIRNYVGFHIKISEESIKEFHSLKESFLKTQSTQKNKENTR